MAHFQYFGGAFLGFFDHTPSKVLSQALILVFMIKINLNQNQKDHDTPSKDQDNRLHFLIKKNLNPHSKNTTTYHTLFS